ncbi:unnamed protein product [Mytilus coruscus]|uniref:B box-type domain-containing protein n=1 Tax=Mytilus coruscus TaxID=42192 RepID=A0A6J8E1L6_MYTCO|nr:unnamed protein product [Mytilus coruscus]
MASSSKSTSMRKAQVLVSCYFCKGQSVKWKCEDCNIRMCNTCKVTVHQGLTSAQDHEVVSIQDTSKSSLGFQETYKKNIFDISLKKNGEILFKEFGVDKIQFLSPAGEVKTVLDSSPMKFLAIHVNRDDEVIVGLREQGPPVPVHDFSVRQVIVFGSDYQRKVTLEFDKKGNKLFSYAARIRTDSRNVVYVIDHFDNDKNGRIVAVDRNSRLRFIYDGHKDLKTFQPEGITITPSDNIVVADRGNDALHVLNSYGDLLGLQLIFKDLGIARPYCVCFDTEGYLLIGCGRGKNEEYGKIYVAKITDSLI